MGQMTFKNTDEFADMVAYCDRHKPQGAYDQRLNPDTVVCLWLVHDQGVYLMPGIVDGGKAEFVIYARGTDPKKNPDTFWDRGRELVGGDDFSEQIELTREIVDNIASGKFTKLVINMTPNAMRVDYFQKTERPANSAREAFAKAVEGGAL